MQRVLHGLVATVIVVLVMIGVAELVSAAVPPIWWLQMVVFFIAAVTVLMGGYVVLYDPADRYVRSFYIGYAASTSDLERGKYTVVSKNKDGRIMVIEYKRRHRLVSLADCGKGADDILKDRLPAVQWDGSTLTPIRPKK